MKKNSKLIRIQIDQFLDGDLSESEVDQLWMKLLKSPEDLDYLETKATLRKMSVEGRAKVSGEAKKLKDGSSNGLQRNKITAYASYLAAASVLIVGVTFTYNTLSGPEYSDLSALAMIEYETERSSDTVTSEFESYLQTAISLSADGEVSQALNNLENASMLDIDDMQKAELFMLEGTVHYNANNFESALESFLKVQSLDNVDPLEYEKSIWYTANSQIQLGMNEEAKASLKNVIALDGAFSRMAARNLERLQ